MSESEIPETVRKRLGAQVNFEEGEEIRMCLYADGILSLGSFRVVINGPFVASPDGRYLAGTRHFDQVAVIVDFDEKREEAFVSGNESVVPHDFHNDAFRFELRSKARTDGPTPKLLELPISQVFRSPELDTPQSDFIRLRPSQDERG